MHYYPCNRNPRALICVLFLVSLILSACVAPPASVVPLAAPAVHPLRICTSSTDATQLSAPVAVATQIDTRYGLDLAITGISGGPTAATALLAGDFDICQIA